MQCSDSTVCADGEDPLCQSWLIPEMLFASSEQPMD